MRYRLSEQKRVGLINKDYYQSELVKVSQSTLPEAPSKPFKESAIQREYEKEAKGHVITPLNLAYNSGSISQADYLRRLEIMLHVMSSNQQSAGSGYRPVIPTYNPRLIGNQYDSNSLGNPYGAGSPYKADGLMNPYSQYGSRYSNSSWTNPYATNAPKLYDSNGKYLGRLSSNKYDPDSVSNPYGRYGSQYSSDSINNPYGAGNPYNSSPIYAVPQR